LKDIYETSKGADNYYALISFVHFEPFNFKACTSEPWVQEMEDEMSQVEKNDTWELVDLPCGKSIVGVKWIYTVKFNMDDVFQNIRHY
jgi:hypothetical protein